MGRNAASGAEAGRSPVAVVLWVLFGCVAFVGAGLWLTQPKSSGQEWDEEWDDEEEWDEERDDEDGRDAEVAEGTSEGVARAAREAALVVDGAAAGVEPEVQDPAPDGALPRMEPPESAVAEALERTGEGAAAGAVALVAANDGGEIEAANPEGTTAESDGGVRAESIDAASGKGGDVTSAVPPSAASSTMETASTPAARGVAVPVSRRPVRRESPPAAPQMVERRVVTLRLTGSLGPTKLSPKDGYTWGRLGYFFQRELRPPYFLVFPDGKAPLVVKPPSASSGSSGPREQSVRSLPPIRPNGALGSPLFLIDLMASVESAGAVTFYGRGVAQKYRCQVRAQVYYLGGEKPQVLDSFTVSETSVGLQGRAAVGPKMRPVYQRAVEKLIERLRSSSYFR